MHDRALRPGSLSLKIQCAYDNCYTYQWMKLWRHWALWEKVSPFCSAYYFTWPIELKNEPTVEIFDNGATCNTSLSTRTLNCSKNIYDVGRVVGERCQAEAHCACAWQRPTTFHVWKTRGCQCSFRLLMMGGVSPETCWALYKYGIIKFWYIVASCWIFLYEFCYDA